MLNFLQMNLLVLLFKLNLRYYKKKDVLIWCQGQGLPDSDSAGPVPSLAAFLLGILPICLSVWLSVCVSGWLTVLLHE